MALVGVLAGAPWPDVAWSRPIVLVPNTVNMFRDTRGLNNVGIGQGDQFQYGADIQGGAAGSTLSAIYPPTGFLSPATICSPLAVNASFCANSTPFNLDRIASPWSFEFVNGTDRLSVPGPSLMDNGGAIRDKVPFPVSVTMTRGATATTPVIGWVVPGGFVPDAFRVNIFDRNDRLPNGTANVIHSVAIDPTSTSYPIPATLTSGRQLAFGGKYAINFQLIETRNHVPLTGNNNALILRRSSSFFAFTPTNDPTPDIHLPKVGVDVDPNDDLAAAYEFSIEQVGPDSVTFIDPVVAVGYDYAVGPGNPNFASVILPEVGDNSYEVIVDGARHVVFANQQFFFAEGGVAAFSVRGIEVSAGLDPGNTTAFITGLTFVRPGQFTGTMTPVVQHVPDGPSIAALGPVALWIGLKNSDDVGLRLDVKAEVFVNGVDTPPIGTGEVTHVSPGSSSFRRASLHTIPLTFTDGEVTLRPGDRLVARVAVRRSCAGGGHAAGTVRLWYDGPAVDSGAMRDAGSRLDAVIDETPVSYYLRRGSGLSATPGAARTSIDAVVNSRVACPDRPFTPLGAWSTPSLAPPLD